MNTAISPVILPTSSPSNDRRRRLTVRRQGIRVRVLVVLALLLSAILTGGIVAPAQAYSFPAPVGPTGSFSVGYATVFSGSNGIYSPPRMSGPVINVARSSSVGANALQKVAVTYSVQKWNGSTWVNVVSKSFTGWIPAGKTYVQFVSESLGDFSGGYYRVGGSVGWYDASSFTLTGYRYFLPTLASENRCAISNCTPYNGYIWFA